MTEVYVVFELRSDLQNPGNRLPDETLLLKSRMDPDTFRSKGDAYMAVRKAIDEPVNRFTRYVILTVLESD
jgi:hypothetical protein